MGKPSENGHCKFPELCDKSGQCEHWLRYNEGCEAADMREAEKKPQAGKTLADFASTRTPLFKRPLHRNPYGFTAGSDHLREIRGFGTKDTFHDFARLTAEDLTATAWEEVTE